MSDCASKNLIGAELAEALIRAHDGNMALLCIWMSVNGKADVEKAAADLCLTKREVEGAIEKLERIGVSFESKSPCSSSSSKKPGELKFYPGAEELPQYTAGDIKNDEKNGGQFQVVVDEAMRILGRALNSSELTKLFGIYDYLSLPPEVIVELLNYCAELTLEKYGPGKRTAFSFIEKEAYNWANSDVRTFEAAEAYITKQKTLRDSTELIKRSLGIKDRALTPTESCYITSWIEMGFDKDCIYEAYDRTVIKTGALSWAYLDKILKTWKEKNILTIKDVNEKDGRGSKAKSSPGSDNFDVEAARLLMNQNRE